MPGDHHQRTLQRRGRRPTGKRDREFRTQTSIKKSTELDANEWTRKDRTWNTWRHKDYEISSGNESRDDARAFPPLRQNPSHKKFEMANTVIQLFHPDTRSQYNTVGEHVPFNIKDKIWEGKFIELHYFWRTQKEMEDNLI